MSMNVNRINQVRETYQGNARRPITKTDKSRSGRDEVTISSEARFYDYANKAAQSQPDIREDVVNGITKRIENGTYNVPSADVAKKMLD